ncbi:MAG: hypothetical protein IKM00_06210 [Clostridia bacterium]|nr:hypothetical protein [Clostridia bacterium]
MIFQERKPLFLGGRLTDRFAVRIPLKCLFGGVGYGLVEVIWRGYTHPSMVITGGLCFAMICAVNGRLAHRSLLFRSAACTAGVTLTEFCVGMLVNHVLRMGVWDYSDEWMHLLGQICPLYTAFWFGLCFLLSFSLSKVHLSAISRNLQK